MKLHLPERTFLLLSSVACLLSSRCPGLDSKVELQSCHLLALRCCLTSSVSPTYRLSSLLWFSFLRADGSVCEHECVWEPDSVSEWAAPAQCRGFLYDDVRGAQPSPSLLLLPCAWPKLLLEHRKGGREIIGHTAANKWAKAVWVNSRQEELNVQRFSGQTYWDIVLHLICFGELL